MKATYAAVFLVIATLLWGCGHALPTAATPTTPSPEPTATVPPEPITEADASGATPRAGDADSDTVARASGSEGATDDIAGIAEAADAFLGLLDATQAAAALLPYDSGLRANWSNLPAGILRFERNGVRVGDLDDRQTAALMDFLTLALSEDGLAILAGVVGAEGVLAQASRAGRLGWSEDNYWLAFFGQPSTATPWGWQFGGHHLAINMAVDSRRITMSPTFIGIEPASYATAAGTAEPLSGAVTAGLALINLLEEPRRSGALLARNPDGILTGAGKDGVVPDREGSPVAAWNASQQEALLAAVSFWVNMLPAHSAALRMREIEAELADAYFAWHGPLDGSGPIYYRIQGPSLIIEFSAEGPVGHAGGHYHSIYRNPANEYGQG